MVDSMIVLPPEFGQTFRVVTDLMTFKLTSTQTQNAFFLCFHDVPPQSGVDMHTQAGQETFIVFDGELEFSTLKDEEVVKYAASRGAVIHVPEGIPHKYQNTSADPASMVVLFTPGGAERFFERVGVPIGDHTQASAPLSPDPEEVEKLLRQYKVRLVAPPPES